MADIIQFPTWALEKERELAMLEFDLRVRRQRLEINEKKIKNERMLLFTRMLIAFCVGLLSMACITLPLI